MFWRASKASYPLQFERVMNDIRLANPNVHKYLTKRDPKTWSRAFFVLHRGCESVENGFSECFNSMILKVRNKPIITMLEAIRVIMMERMHKMRRICDGWVDDICPSYRKKLEWVKLQHRYWNVVPGGGSKFEVRKGHDAFIVDDEKRSCEHSVAAIYFLHKNPDDYVTAWFRKEMYIKAYNNHIQPVQGMNQWPTNELNKPLPPMPRKMPERPKKKRKRVVHEPLPSHTGKVSKVGITMTCQICQQEGHNRRSCKREPIAKPPRPPQKKVGRPKKDANKGLFRTEGTSKEAVKGNSMVEDTSTYDGKGKKYVKEKGKVVVEVPLTDIPRPSGGGFMSDARRSYQPVEGVPQIEDSKNKGKVKKVEKLIPKTRKNERLPRLHLARYIPGPGSSKDQVMEIE